MKCCGRALRGGWGAVQVIDPAAAVELPVRELTDTLGGRAGSRSETVGGGRSSRSHLI